METVEDALNRWKKKIDESWQKRWDENGWHKEDDLSAELKVDYWDQYDDEYAEPVKAVRRAKRKELIEKALKECTILDLDAIYEDGKLFGRKLRYLDYENAEGNPDVCRFVVFDYKEKPYKVRLKFNFEDSVIDLWVGEYCERIGNNVGASTTITFKELYNETKEIANKIFEEKAKMIIAGIRRNLGEND